MKTLIFHALCCKSEKDLDPSKRKLGWYLSSIPGVGSFVPAIVAAIFATPAIIAANPYSHMPPVDIFSSFVAGMPIWYAWMVNFILVMVGYFVLQQKELNRSVGSAVLAYFALTIAEYAITLFGLSLIAPH